MSRVKKTERGVRGLGSVYPVERHRKDGTVRKLYCAALVYRDRAGQQQRVVAYAESSDAAAQKLKQLQSRPDVVAQLPPTKGTVGAFIESWLATVITPNLRSSTSTTYRATFRTHIESYPIAKRPIAKVGPSDIDALYAAHVQGGISDRTRRKVHDLLSGAFRYALERREMAADPMLGIKRPSYAAPSVTALSADQIDAFLGAAEGDPLEALFVLTIFTGMRSGEVLALRWRDLDLAAGVVMVSSTLRDTGAKKKDALDARVIASPKTSASARTVQLPKIVVRALTAHRKRAGEPIESSALVFPNERGKPLWRQNLLRRSYYPLLERAGLVDENGRPLLSFHDLRHVHGTEMFRAGVHPKVVQERLGHSRIGVTLDIYSSSVPGMQQAATRSIDRAFSGSAYATRRATREAKMTARKDAKKTPETLISRGFTVVPRAGIEPATPGFSDLCSTN